jgi:hypothetical protein
VVISACVILLIAHVIIAKVDYGYSEGKAGFSVRFKQEVSPYRVSVVTVLPGELLELEAIGQKRGARYMLDAPAGEIVQSSKYKWQWQAPVKKGLYPVKVIRAHSKDSITLNVFVMIPYSELKGEYVNGYRIGRYPVGRYDYRVPRGFIEVTKANEETFVSPHFKLKQFICKQKDNYPKYIVLKEKLLLKLELILEKMNERGYNCSTFHIMSGYRTPYYNKLLGNVKYSRHVYGEAADIFIDEAPAKYLMDDLNYDRKINYRDAVVFYKAINDMYDKEWYSKFKGGLAWYKTTSTHGPFIHIDVRGRRARWGGTVG